MLIYNLDFNDAWLRAHEYRKSKGVFENLERMLMPVSPVDLMDEALDPDYERHHSLLMFNATYPRKEKP